MASVKGDLSLMSLPDILQWCEMNHKTGTLVIENGQIKKRFYLENGKIIFISSNKKGESLIEQILKKNLISSEILYDALHKSKQLKIPFTGFLISENLATLKTLENLFEDIVEIAFLDALRWEDGRFEFTDTIPQEVMNGPVKLNVSFIILQSLKLLDELEKGRPVDERKLIRKLTDDIYTGKVNLPPVPDIVSRLNEAMNRDDFSLNEIIKLIMADQILTSKILRIVNSAFYAKYHKITSLQEAVIYIGLKSLISIVTVHVISGMSPKNPAKVKEILKHSLITAFVAKKLAPFFSEDPEEAFVCGLLHDIGKTVIVEYIENYRLSEEALEEIIQRFHTEIGGQLAEKWRFSDSIKTVIKYHHKPEKTEKHSGLVRLIATANNIAHKIESTDDVEEELVKIKYLNKQQLISDIKKLLQEIDLFVT